MLERDFDNRLFYIINQNLSNLSSQGMHANMLQMQAREVLFIVEKFTSWIVLLWGTTYGHTFCSSDYYSVALPIARTLNEPGDGKEA